MSAALFASGPAYAALYTRSRARRLSSQRMHAPSVRWSSGTRARVPLAEVPNAIAAAADGQAPSSLFVASTNPSAFRSTRFRWNAMPCRTTALEARSSVARLRSSR